MSKIKLHCSLLEKALSSAGKPWGTVKKCCKNTLITGASKVFCLRVPCTSIPACANVGGKLDLDIQLCVILSDHDVRRDQCPVMWHCDLKDTHPAILYTSDDSSSGRGCGVGHTIEFCNTLCTYLCGLSFQDSAPSLRIFSMGPIPWVG